MAKFTMEKTDQKISCSRHGDGVAVHIHHVKDDGFGYTMDVCYRCVDAAIDQYRERLSCTGCGTDVERGFGVEKDGVLIPYCRECQAKHLFSKLPVPNDVHDHDEMAVMMAMDPSEMKGQPLTVEDIEAGAEKMKDDKWWEEENPVIEISLPKKDQLDVDGILGEDKKFWKDVVGDKDQDDHS